MKSRSAWKIDRRSFLKATGMGLAGASLSGLVLPGSVGAAEAMPLNIAPEKGASLKLLRWSGFVKSDEEIWNKNTKKWEDQTGCKMSVEYISWEDVRPKAAMAASVGAGPDLVLGWFDDPFLYPDKLVPVSDVCDYLGKKYGGWYPIFHEYGYYRPGKRWIAVPFGTPGACSNYRISWVKEAGYEKFPLHFDDMLQCSKKLKANGHPVGYTFGHGVGDGNGVCYWILFQFGGKIVEADNKTVALNRKETWDALEFAKGWYDTMAPGVIGWLDPDNNKAFLSGQISATYNGISIYYAAKQNFPDIAKDMDHVPMGIGPLGKPRQVHNLTTGFIFKHTQFPNAAKHYLTFMMEKDQYGPWIDGMLGYVTQSLKDYAKLPIWTSDPKITPFRDIPERMVAHNYAGYPGPHAAASIGEYIVVDMFEAVVSGRSTPKDAAGEAQKRLATIYGA